MKELWLERREVLIVSPQAWGGMRISKHHYAVEIASRGNRVHFLNPPDQKGALRCGGLKVTGVDGTPNLYMIEHRPWFPYLMRFKAPALYSRLMALHIRGMQRRLPNRLDVVWSFDLNQVVALRHFADIALRVFHAVDEPQHTGSVEAATGAHVIFGVTPEIVSKYGRFAAPRHVIGHGLASEFLAVHATTYRSGPVIRVGSAGNLLRPDIDRATLLRIIDENPAVEFEFWGSFEPASGNVGGSNDACTRQFIGELRRRSRVKLHGVTATKELAYALHSMDAFLICYDINRDQSRGTNYHKVLEYLSTGRVIISNNVTAYHGRPDLIQMTAERDSNRALPELFSRVLGDLANHNTDERFAVRRAFAEQNTYRQQLARIEYCLSILD